MPTSPNRVEVFFSYAHKDQKLRDQLEEHLANLKRQGVISAWHDRKIGAGQEWAGSISQHLESAKIILLLISPSFIASDYCHDIELKRAMERHRSGEARVIPVILRPVDWRGAEFGDLQGLPRDAKPVTTWRNRDDAYKSIADGVRLALESLMLTNMQNIYQPSPKPSPIGGQSVLTGESQPDKLIKRKNIIIIHHKDDIKFSTEMLKHMSTLGRTRIVDTWNISRNPRKSGWEGDFEERVNSCKLAIILVSASLLASDEMYSPHFLGTLGDNQERGLIVKAIIVRPCLFAMPSPLEKVQPINSPDKPLTGMRMGDQMVFIIQTIRNIETSII